MEVSLCYQPVTHEVADTSASVDIARIRYAAKLGVCWIHPDVRVQHKTLFGKQDWKQECHRCREIHEVALLEKRLAASAKENSEESKENNESKECEGHEDLKEIEKSKESEVTALPLAPVSDEQMHHDPQESNQSRRDRDFDGPKFKVLLVGDSGVGKSWLLQRAANHDSVPHRITTIGIDFKNLRLRTYENDDVKFQLWDTAGAERFRTVTRAYFRGTNSIIICYDITDRESFSNTKSWASDIALHAAPNVNAILVGLKADAEGHREVTYEEGFNRATQFGMLFFECSAKEGINVIPLLHAAYRQSTRIERMFRARAAPNVALSVDNDQLQQQIVTCNAPECVETMTTHNSLTLQWSVGAETAVLITGELQFELQYSVAGGLYTFFWSRVCTDQQRHELLHLPPSTRVVARVRARVVGQRKWGAWSDYSFDMYNHPKQGWNAWIEREKARSTSDTDACTRLWAANSAKYFPDTLVGAVVDVPGKNVGKVLQYNRSWRNDRSSDTFTIEFADGGVENVLLTTHALRTFWKCPRQPYHVVELPSEPSPAAEASNEVIILLLGDSGTGKTTMFQTFLGEQTKATTSTLQVLPRSFHHQPRVTYATSADLGLDPVQGSVMDIPGDHRLARVLLDANGSLQERLKRVTAFVIVYSIDSQRSFDHVFSHWWAIKRGIEELNGAVLPTIVVGNKADLRGKSNRETLVAQGDGPKQCQQLDVPHVETSATARPDSVLDAFDLLIKLQQENLHAVGQVEVQAGEAVSNS